MDSLKNAHALIVGIAAYQHIRPLPAVVLADCRDLEAILVHPDICGYPREQVVSLLDEQATLSGLRGALRNLQDRAAPDSSVFLYVSSHGGRIASGPAAGEYLLPVDTRLRPGVAAPEPDPSTAISGNELAEALGAIPARKLVAVFDCCHSGGIGNVAKEVAPTYAMGLTEGYLDRLAGGRGRVMIASSRNDEQSLILPRDTNSLFTKHLKAGLLGGAPPRDGLIHIFELFEYIQPRVTAENTSQHPVLQVKLEENFPIALYLGGRKAAVPAADTGQFRYDAYISWVRAPEDTQWFHEEIFPRLRQAGLRIAMTGRVEEPGVPAVIGVQRAIELSRRTVVLLSRRYLESGWAELESVAAGHLSVEERKARLLPVVIDDALVDQDGYLNQRVPLTIRQLSALNLVDDLFGADNLARLPEILAGPVPRR